MERINRERESERKRNKWEREGGRGDEKAGRHTHTWLQVLSGIQMLETDSTDYAMSRLSKGTRDTNNNKDY